MTSTRAGRMSLWAAVAIGCSRQQIGSAAPDERARGPAAASMSCPAGTQLRGAAPPAGTRAWCERADGSLHGPVVEWFGDGRRRMRGEYRDGAKHGTWSSWYDDEQPRSEEHWSAGTPTGTWTTYFADGKRSTESRHAAGGAIAFQSFRPDGSKLRQGTYRGGREHGTWTEWDVAGVAITSEWKDGVRVGGVAAALGVPECDAYIAGYARCIDEHVPESSRASMRESLDATVLAWRNTLTDPNLRGALEQGCKAANESARLATASMGCTW